MIKYTYSIQNDFPNHKVATDRLLQEIVASAIVTASDHIDTVGDVCDVWFKGTLSPGDEVILDGLVAVHSGEPLPNTALLVELGSPSTSDGKPIFLPCLFPGNVFLYPTGVGDNIANQTRGDGQAFFVECTAEQDYTVEWQFIDWVYLAGGGVKWKNGEPGDWISLLVYALATPVTPNGGGTGNCNLVDPGVGQAILIVPANGNGAYDVNLNNAIPIPAYDENRFGEQTPTGFYEWSCPNTGKGTVTAGAPQQSYFNLFAVEINLARFANRLQLIDSGVQDLTVPAIKPKMILPHWKFKVIAHHVVGVQNFTAQWWLTTARTTTI